MYVASFESVVHAAMAYDIMALQQRGARAYTNFDTSLYAPLMPYLEDDSIDQVDGRPFPGGVERI
jgi:hypothetical protein